MRQSRHKVSRIILWDSVAAARARLRERARRGHRVLAAMRATHALPHALCVLVCLCVCGGVCGSRLYNRHARYVCTIRACVQQGDVIQYIARASAHQSATHTHTHTHQLKEAGRGAKIQERAHFDKDRHSNEH